MTFAYFTPKPGNLNILGSYDTLVSDSGPPWPSCLQFGIPRRPPFAVTKNSAEHENDNISIIATWILTKVVSK